MYLQRIVLQNTGPITKLDFRLPFMPNGDPKPLILVGPNGSGKSIFLSFVINSLLAARQAVYDDVEVEANKVYKYRSPAYVKSGSQFYFANLLFEGGIETAEWQLLQTRKEFEQVGLSKPVHPSWNELPEDQNSIFWGNFQLKRQVLDQIFKKNTLLYFPANRFEEPGWLNSDNLTRRPEYTDRKHISGRSERTVIQHSPLGTNRNWVMDIVLDRQISEINTSPFLIQTADGPSEFQIFKGFSGSATRMFEAVNEVLGLTMKSPDIRIGIGNRQRRNISVMKNEQELISNLFQLSTGETAVLNMFVSVLRDYDEAGVSITRLEDVRGIVVIDEIDAHLHVELQSSVLPQLIKRFPKVQFVITTHSPLFLIGLRRELTEDGFSVIALPEGYEIGVERFSEFQHAYDALKDTAVHQKEVAAAVANSLKPVVIVEGEYDIRYLTKASQLLGREAFVSRLTLMDGEGFGNLDKVWKSLDSKAGRTFTHQVVLLYDCDVKKQDDSRGKVFRRVMASVPSNPIHKGVENLFAASTLEKAKTANSRFVDITPAYSKTVRGDEEAVPELWEINRDEKGNLCTWICENGTADDFSQFSTVFDQLEAVLNQTID